MHLGKFTPETAVSTKFLKKGFVIPNHLGFTPSIFFDTVILTTQIFRLKKFMSNENSSCAKGFSVFSWLQPCCVFTQNPKLTCPRMSSRSKITWQVLVKRRNQMLLAQPCCVFTQVQNLHAREWAPGVKLHGKKVLLKRRNQKGSFSGMCFG